MVTVWVTAAWLFAVKTRTTGSPTDDVADPLEKNALVAVSLLGSIGTPVLAKPGLPATGSTCEPDVPPPPTSAGAAAGMAAVSATSTEARTDSQDERLQLLAHVKSDLQRIG